MHTAMTLKITRRMLYAKLRFFTSSALMHVQNVHHDPMEYSLTNLVSYPLQRTPENFLDGNTSTSLNRRG